MNHVTHANRGAPRVHLNVICEFVISHNVTRMNEVIHISHLQHTYESFMSQISMVNESCHTNEAVIARILVGSSQVSSHVTHMNGSCHTCE